MTSILLGRADGGDRLHGLSATIAQGGVFEPRLGDEARPVLATKRDELAVLVTVDDGHLVGARRAVLLLSATTHEICEGELLQIGSCHEPDITEDLYFEIIRKKTAILHGVACEIAGRLAGLDAERTELLRHIGLDLGMAFQVVDDCLDYTGAEEIVGKSLGTDLRQGKLTLPLMYLRDDMIASERDWLRLVLRGPIDAESEARIQNMIRANGVLLKSFARAESFVQSAKSSLLELAVVSDPRAVAARESLELAADYVLRRDR